MSARLSEGKKRIETVFEKQSKAGMESLFAISDETERGISSSKAIEKVNNIVKRLLENDSLIENMLRIGEYDNYTFIHSVNVTIFSLILGLTMHLEEDSLYELCVGACLHDVGKIFIDNKLLNKAGKFTEGEFALVQAHSMDGYIFIKNNYPNIPQKSLEAILQHHEKVDGSGYPHQKAGDEISLYGKIVSIADVYDALVSERSYKKAMEPSEAINFLYGNKNKAFDGVILGLFEDFRKVKNIKGRS